MKLSKLMWVLLSASLFLGSCNFPSQVTTPASFSTKPEELLNKSQEEKDILSNFNSAFINLKNQLDGLNKNFKDENYKSPAIELREISENFRKIKTISSSNNNYIHQLSNDDVLNELTSIEKPQSNNQEESNTKKFLKLKQILNSKSEEYQLAQTGIYEKDTNKALHEYLIKTIDPLIAQVIRDLNQETKKAPMPSEGNISLFEVFSLFIALLSLGTSGVLFWLLSHSNKRFEKMIRDDRKKSEEWMRKVKDNFSHINYKQINVEAKLSHKSRQQDLTYETPRNHEEFPKIDQPQVSESMHDYTPKSESDSSFRPRGFDPQSAWRESKENLRYMLESSSELIIRNYNTNPSTIESNAQGVSETEDSIYQRRRDSTITQVTFKNVSNYSYWVIADADGNYWLMPKTDLKLNPMNFDTFQAVFQFQGQPEGRLQLVKPAKVNQTISNEWELAEKGEVYFI
ncbi:MAG TPA: hypothetical protein V6D19_10385 [Stenomitos sp.]